MAPGSRTDPKGGGRCRLVNLTCLAVLAVSAGTAVATAPPELQRLAGEERQIPAAGRYLVAKRQVRGPVFGRSVVLVLEANAGGAAGLIVNRPTGLALRELFPESAALAGREDRVHLGGPVEPRGLLFLVRTEKPPVDSSPLVGDLHVGRSAEALHEVVERGVPSERFRSFIGHAGWAPGQLEHEIRRGDWYVIEGDPTLAFREGGDEIWRTLLRSLEAIRVRAPGEAHPPACRLSCA